MFLRPRLSPGAPSHVHTNSVPSAIGVRSDCLGGLRLSVKAVWEGYWPIAPVPQNINDAHRRYPLRRRDRARWVGTHIDDPPWWRPEHGRAEGE